MLRIALCRAAAAVAATLTLLAGAPTGASATYDPLRDRQWNLDMVRAAAAHHVSIGRGALVAVLDSGVEASHPDLAGSVVAGPDLVGADGMPDDESGHGTHVAGIVAAHRGNRIGIAGAAPGARILAIRILGADNRGTLDHEAAGIDAAVAAGAHVINLSLSPDPAMPGAPDSMLIEAIERAANAGVVVVAAAGNYRAPVCNQPRVAARILCVGAVDRFGRRANYSNYAERIDIAAPGEDIISLGLGGRYPAKRGTSQAAPHVAAAAALLVSLGLRGSAVVDRLQRTATRLGGDARLGHGLLNMGAAVAGLLRPARPAQAPARSAPRPALVARTPRRVRYRTVRRRGLPVVCASLRAGSCHVRVTSRGHLLAWGSRHVEAATPATVRAWLTAIGHRELSFQRRIAAGITVTQPGTYAAQLVTTLER